MIVRADGEGPFSIRRSFPNWISGPIGYLADEQDAIRSFSTQDEAERFLREGLSPSEIAGYTFTIEPTAIAERRMAD